MEEKYNKLQSEKLTRELVQSQIKIFVALDKFLIFLPVSLSFLGNSYPDQGRS